MYEETLVVLKPDALERRLIGSIIQRFEEASLEVLDLHYITKVDEEMITKHYPSAMARGLGEKAQKATSGITDPVAHGMKVLERLRVYFTRGPVLAMRIGGEGAIQAVRRVTGYTDPLTAEKGTIRGDYGVDSLSKSTEEERAVENLVHASGNPEEARAELELWFPG